MSELVYRKPCPHGLTERHNLWHDIHDPSTDRCPGGSEVVLDGDMVLTIKYDPFHEWSVNATVADVLAALDGREPKVSDE